MPDIQIEPLNPPPDTAYADTLALCDELRRRFIQSLNIPAELLRDDPAITQSRPVAPPEL